MIVIFNWVAKGIAILIIITLHEFIKARVSTSLGDPKPKMQRRLTLNPFKHFEPIGFVIMLVYGFGWGKPVETTATYYKNRKWGMVFTYTAPIICCIAFATICAVLGRIITPVYLEFATANIAFGNLDPLLQACIIETPILLLFYTAFYGYTFAFFNLLPVYPLDGEKILSAFLEPNAVIKMRSLEKILLIILVILIVSGFVAAIFNPIALILLNTIGFFA